MVALNKQYQGTARGETMSLMVNALVSRIANVVARPGADHPMLRPTVFIPVRRGENLTFQDVVARRV